MDTPTTNQNDANANAKTEPRRNQNDANANAKTEPRRNPRRGAKVNLPDMVLTHHKSEHDIFSDMQKKANDGRYCVTRNFIVFCARQTSHIIFSPSTTNQQQLSSRKSC